LIDCLIATHVLDGGSHPYWYMRLHVFACFACRCLQEKTNIQKKEKKLQDDFLYQEYVKSYYFVFGSSHYL
jgi:hypothetical protein